MWRGKNQRRFLGEMTIPRDVLVFVVVGDDRKLGAGEDRAGGTTLGEYVGADLENDNLCAVLHHAAPRTLGLPCLGDAKQPATIFGPFK